MFQPPMMRRPDSTDDRHVISKHGQIYPSDEHLASIQKQVSVVERALKAVSDNLGEIEGGSKLKGVMRVGPLSKGLLLKSDTEVNLVLLCAEIPTRDLLGTVVNKLQTQLANKNDSDNVNFVITQVQDEARIEVTASISVHIGLTSPSVRNEDAVFNEETLPKEKCIEFLASLRHAKGFGARAAGLQSAVMILRVLRELDAWPLKPFAMELIVEKALASVGLPLSPGDAIRRVFEAVAGGILLPGSPGLLDPCEKEPQDTAADLTPQQREDITSNAQRNLRLIAFRQIHNVLNMDQLQPPKFPKGRKRPAAIKSQPQAQDIESSSVEVKKDQNGGEPKAKRTKESS
jgi:zinc finger RNA-binding protein